MVIFDPGKYHFINQGCLTADTVQDKEELLTADVRTTHACHVMYLFAT